MSDHFGTKTDRWKVQ